MQPSPPPSLLTLLGGDAPTVRIVDVGALWLGDEAYGPLIKADAARVVGFEPLAAQCEALNRKFGPRHVYLPFAVGDGATRRFHSCNYPMTSSLYEPDLELMAPYYHLPEFSHVESAWDVETKRLEDIPEAHGADYVKLDVQGAELDVLKGAGRMLDSVLAIHAEVEFLPIYKGQPLFGDVDAFLREAGFQFHRFFRIEGRALRTVGVQHDTLAERSQQLWADAVYIRGISSWSRLPPGALLKLAVILHEVYGSFDFAAALLARYDAAAGTSFRAAYQDAMGIAPAA